MSLGDGDGPGSVAGADVARSGTDGQRMARGGFSQVSQLPSLNPLLTM